MRLASSCALCALLAGSGLLSGCMGMYNPYGNPYSSPYGASPYGSPYGNGSPYGGYQGTMPYGTYPQQGIQTLTPGGTYVPGTVPDTTNPGGTFQNGGGLQPIPQPGGTPSGLGTDGKEVTVPQPYMQRPTGMLDTGSNSIAPASAARIGEPATLSPMAEMKPIPQRQPSALTADATEFVPPAQPTTPFPALDPPQFPQASPSSTPAAPAASGDLFLSPAAPPASGTPETASNPFAPAAPAASPADTNPPAAVDIFGGQ